MALTCMTTTVAELQRVAKALQQAKIFSRRGYAFQVERGRLYLVFPGKKRRKPACEHCFVLVPGRPGVRASQPDERGRPRRLCTAHARSAGARLAGHCEHGRKKSECKDCGGSQICEHGRMKAKCKDCGGSQICQHGRRKSQCKDCGGSQICQHDRRKQYCRDCGGSQICEHDRLKAKCKDCGGSQICQHGLRKGECSDCGGSQICEHRRIKSNCKDCGGSQICQHGRRKSQCKNCGGSQICEHSRRKDRCIEGLCGLQPSSSKCIGCCSKLVNRIPGVPSSALCAECRAEHQVGQRRKWEEQMESWLTGAGLVWSHSGKKLPCAVTTRYPDYLFAAGGEHCVLLEVDEHEHRNYVDSCEIARISEIQDSISCLNLHVIRYNPHVKGRTSEKKAQVLTAVRDALASNFGRLSDAGVVVQYIGYSRDRVVHLDQLTCRLQGGEEN